MKSMNVILSTVLVAFISFAFVHITKVQAEEKGKGVVGVVVSELSEKYAFIERKGGTYNGKSIAEKPLGSSIKNKRIKAKLLLESLGYKVEYVDDAQLKDPAKLAKYDTLFFPNTVMMSKEQRQAVKEYIKNGGGAIFAFAMARNDSARFPYKTTDLDLTPIIYDTETWIWEWDNLSELFQSAFINDVKIGNYTVASTNNHPIVKKALQRLGTSKLVLKNSRYHQYGPEWIEVIHPYPNSYVTPILYYETIGYSNVPKHTPANTGAAYAIEYGRGKAVWFGFQLLNYISVDTSLSNEWDMTNPLGKNEIQGEAWQGLKGGEELKVLIDEAIQWTSQPLTTSHPIDRSVTVSLTDVKAYPRANDYVVYGTMTANNEGNVVSRGTMRVELLDPSGNVKTSYEKYVVGLVPKGKSYPEKFQLILPKNLPTGNYQLVAYYHAGRKSKDGLKIAGVTKVISIKNSRSKATILDFAPFKDIPNNHWAKKDIDVLASLGVIKPEQNQTFKPNAPVTRLQAATMIVRSLGLSTKNRPNPKLADVKQGRDGYDIVATVIDEGIFSGSNGRFYPNAPLTREQMAKILVKAYQLTGEEDINFQDVALSRWSHPYIATLKANQVTKASGYFRPNEQTTRAEFAAFVRRAMLAMGK
ncbi:hypothetical protein HNR31_001359 [Anoxybacillus caldiproteolyticus]|uniref:SLH domain-containing protein n=2 Tax=Thermaerobacillus caldiproteolyticus TaxID=247480 RepID=A0A7V9Z5S8_9BACL|nr:hypothetical protein [Anoxybacillus caldiproteolyticus]